MTTVPPIRRLSVLGLAGLFLVHAGCGGGPTTLTREELVDPAPAKSYTVGTRDGEELTFISLHLEDETLYGTRRVTISEEVGEGEEARTQVTNRYQETSIPWSDVEYVSADERKSKEQGFFLAAGAIVVAGVAFLLLSGGSDDASEDGGGKPGPDGP